MRAISLWQPWATLIALGEKRIETRSWNPNYEGPILIHASKRWTREQQEIITRPVFRDALGDYGITEPMPLGGFVARGNLGACFLSDEVYESEGGRLASRLQGNESAFGDYSLGRWCWLIYDVVMLPELIPARGFQRLWTPTGEHQRAVSEILG